MSQSAESQHPEAQRIVVVGPEGQVVAEEPAAASTKAGGSVTDLVEEPGKVMRIGTMVKQLLDEVKAAPLDEAGRARMREIHSASVRELEDGLAPELVAELRRFNLPFSDDSVPSEAELRIAQAQLVGWLEGLFHGIQTTLVAQQMSVRAQVAAEMQRRALPGAEAGGGMEPPGRSSTGQYL